MNDIIVKNDEMTGEQCKIARLDNGLTVYFIPSEFCTSHALLGVDYGSVHTRFKLDGKETATPDGIAHFLEHKLFDNPDGCADDIFTSLGANCNAFTSFSSTAYTFSCTENFYPALQALLDFVYTPYFTSETVKKEQGIISEEIKMYDDSAAWKAYMNLLYCMYGDCPVSHDTAGTEKSILKITPSLLHTCYLAFYVPSNMRLCIYADADFEKIIELCNKVEKKPRISEKIPIKFSDSIFKEHFEYIMDTPKPIICIGVKDTDIPKTQREKIRKSACMQMILNMLFSESGNFFNELYSSSLIYSRIEYEYVCEDDFAFSSLYCESDSTDEIFTRFKNYIESIKKDGFDRDEFLKNKKLVYADFIRMFDSGENVTYELFLKGENLIDYASIISEITAEYAEKIFIQMFTYEHYAMSVVHS